MQRSLNITSVGLWLSATLAVLYVIVTLASLLLVSLLTTGSWQAAFLGTGWSTVAGFEIGLLVILILSFAIALVFVLTYNFIQLRIVGRSRISEQAGQSDWSSSKSWRVRLLGICLVLPALALVLLRVLASAGVFTTSTQGNGARTQAMNMGPIVNTAYREAEPSFTANGKTMYFNCNNGDICISHLIGTWEEGNWTSPERLGVPISTVYEEIEPVIDGDGDKLYFTSIRPGRRLWSIPFLSPFIDVFRLANILATAKLGRSFFGGLGFDDVYVSYWINGAWSEPQNLNEIAGEPPVNTEFADHCLFFSANGAEAFWTSTRPGGFGDDDIWTSRRVGGKWTEPENLGPNVNGPGSEHTSIPTPDGQSLYITTARAEGYGGEDIYVTTRGTQGSWGSLVNLGPQVNGAGDDRCPTWTPDLRIFLFDSVREGGFGGKDVWWVYFKDVEGYPRAVAASPGTASGAP